MTGIRPPSGPAPRWASSGPPATAATADSSWPACARASPSPGTTTSTSTGSPTPLGPTSAIPSGSRSPHPPPVPRRPARPPAPSWNSSAPHPPPVRAPRSHRQPTHRRPRRRPAGDGALQPGQGPARHRPSRPVPPPPRISAGKAATNACWVTCTGFKASPSVPPRPTSPDAPKPNSTARPARAAIRWARCPITAARGPCPERFTRGAARNREFRPAR